MKFITTVTVVLCAIPAALGASSPASVSFDQTYDDASNSLDIVSCSDGQNGLITKGFTTFGSLPSFPNIGGAAAVAGFNSPNCGTCWELEFEGNTINVLAIDHTLTGFNIALAAMNTLTNGNAQFLGRINATATQVAGSACGLN
ncbi:hypothetical protein EUX98_g2747 [Antrodiella citrinella]|uniref:Cerato-platanin n=1 Tax=Antrodiella citrinella TaxID=2447956 RepID=A0A4S4N147_9APHY|nr:hypothetical protein EUX98_g2747 [Antrodiella citrinella]